MKFIAASTLALAAIAKADETTTQEPIGPRKFNSIVSMTYSQITTNHDKNTFGDMINKYGCHCFPNGSKAAGGQGAAVDGLDSVCKRLYKCHKCIQLTWGPDAVDVNDGRYTWGLDGDGSLNCDKNSNNPARRALCECDRAFAGQMKNIWDDASYNTYYWLNNKHARQNPETVFSYDDTCVANGQGTGAAADVCCGEDFPNMEPYDSTNRGCCASSTVFNLITQECCTDGTINSIGSC